MRLIRTLEIQLLWDGNKVCAPAGPDLQKSVEDDVPAALLDLVRMVRADGDTTIWVPRPAKQFEGKRSLP